MPTAKPTAFDRFTRHADDCAALLDHLQEVLDEARRRAQAEPGNWGHAGSMEEVRNRLVTTLAFISRLEEEDIEAVLADLRE